MCGTFSGVCSQEPHLCGRVGSLAGQRGGGRLGPSPGGALERGGPFTEVPRQGKDCIHQSVTGCELLSREGPRAWVKQVSEAEGDYQGGALCELSVPPLPVLISEGESETVASTAATV